MIMSINDGHGSQNVGGGLAIEYKEGMEIKPYWLKSEPAMESDRLVKYGTRQNPARETVSPPAADLYLQILPRTSKRTRSRRLE